MKYSSNLHVRKSQYNSFGLSDTMGYGHSAYEKEQEIAKRKKSSAPKWF